MVIICWLAPHGSVYGNLELSKYTTFTSRIHYSRDWVEAGETKNTCHEKRAQSSFLILSPSFLEKVDFHLVCI